MSDKVKELTVCFALGSFLAFCLFGITWLKGGW
jgi:hypothetical protein